MARRRIADSSDEIRMQGGDLAVRERVLDNGLKVLVLPRPGSAIVVCDLYYPAGSADERPGKTGLAHFVEHMLFKGTARFPKGQLDRLTFAAAGEANASTSEDFTHYWFRFPRDEWELALAVEADRMRGALFDREEVEAERRVIVEERARDLDSPAGRLEEEFLLRCYASHPYRHPILGWPEDLARLEAADLRRFYRRHYRPDGAVLALVGDLEPERALRRVEDHFGTIPRGPAIAARPAAGRRGVPRQHRRRSHRLRDSERVTRGLLGWHTVARPHEDSAALGVLADLLTCGRRARLWDRLVERDHQAVTVDVSHDAGRLAGQMVVSIEAAPGAEPRRLESIVREEIDRLAAYGPTPGELLRCRTRLEAAWRWQQDDLAGLAGSLGSTALWDEWSAWPARHRAELAVEAEDLRRVAARYLGDSGLTAVWSVPRTTFNGRARSIVARPSPVARTVMVEITAPPRLIAPTRRASLSDFRPTRGRLANGLRILTQRMPGSGVVALDLHVEAGQLVEARPGLACLTANLREEGTTTRSAEALSEAVEDVGGFLDVFSKGSSMHVRREDLGLALDVLADLTLRPAFPVEALAWTKRRLAADLRADRDDPMFRADESFRRLVYGDHPYARDARGSAGALAALTLQDVWSHHDRWFRPDNAFLVVVGDFDPVELRRLARASFGSWEALYGRLEFPKSAAPPPRRAIRRRTTTAGEQVHLIIGHLGISRRHRDYDALAVLDHVLGSGPGFTDRLNAVLRDELGLAYSVHGGITENADTEAGTFRVYVGTSAEQADRAEAAVLEQIEAMRRGEFTEYEVEQAKRYLQGSWLFDYQGLAHRADRLVELEGMGLPLDEPLRWPRRLERLGVADIRRAAAEHLHPDQLIRVIRGPRAPRRVVVSSRMRAVDD